jgi:hypothetical protein
MPFDVSGGRRSACEKGEWQFRVALSQSSAGSVGPGAVIATLMYMAFDDKRPWVSAFRTPFGADAPPVEMRICTRLKRSEEMAEDGLPSHPGYPPAMMVRILAAWPLMLFSRPVGTLP